ncbi:trypsin delta-like [Chrysoperla carnea]|uniref:trypsin delta-like n=1 Tax=Chrysoperla carnea TaxID=189513 RepID=UPI001D05DDFE|nr:trypsin delta-like [Chrysoperla carnea]
MANYKYSIGLSFIIYILIIGYLRQCLATSPKSSSTQNTNAIRDDQMISNSTYLNSLIMHQTTRNNLKESSVPENRILNGQPATVGQFPYQVIVYASNLNVCGGAVLNKNTIITAAQCLYYPDKNQLIPENEIKVGAGDVNSNEINMKHFTVKSVHPHEMYNQKTFKNDLAIIKINEIFWDESPTPNIQPIEIASTQYKSGTNCVLAGWGKTEPHSKPLQFLNKNFRVLWRTSCFGIRLELVVLVCFTKSI